MWFYLLLNEIKIFLYGRSFSSCYKLRTKEKFRFPIRNQTSDLWIPRSDAVPLSFRELCGVRGHFWIHTWHAFCILLGPAMSKASFCENWLVTHESPKSVLSTGLKSLYWSESIKTPSETQISKPVTRKYNFSCRRSLQIKFSAHSSFHIQFIAHSRIPKRAWRCS